MKPTAIPADLAPILERLHVAGDAWVEQVQHFGRWFRRAVGRASTLSEAAAQRGHQWLQGISKAAPPSVKSLRSHRIAVS